MDRKQIEQWAREADELLDHPPRPPTGANDLLLMRDERFAALVEAHVRDQCAKRCLEIAVGLAVDEVSAQDCADAIREMATNNKKPPAP